MNNPNSPVPLTSFQQMMAGKLGGLPSAAEVQAAARKASAQPAKTPPPATPAVKKPEKAVAVPTVPKLLVKAQPAIKPSKPVAAAVIRNMRSKEGDEEGIEDEPLPIPVITSSEGKCLPMKERVFIILKGSVSVHVLEAGKQLEESYHLGIGEYEAQLIQSPLAGGASPWWVVKVEDKLMGVRVVTWEYWADEAKAGVVIIAKKPK